MSFRKISQTTGLFLMILVIMGSPLWARPHGNNGNYDNFLPDGRAQPQFEAVDTAVYEGSGQITSGPGSGGVVGMRVVVEGTRYRVVEGPRMEIDNPPPSFFQGDTEWQINRGGQYLYITVRRPNGQVIQYALMRTR
ncbi:MAG: hypothetical protein WCA07_07295 [Gloeobacterales cyanobacterium]